MGAKDAKRSKRAKDAKRARTAAERKRAQRRRERAIKRRKCAGPKRRARLEADTPKWIAHYAGAPDRMPYSPGHLAIIEGVERAVKNKTGIAVAIPRGDGKTTLLRSLAINLVFRGLVRFPVMVGWKIKDSTTAFKRTWLHALSASGRLQKDYPEFTQPFEESINSKALAGLTWEDTGSRIGADVDNRCGVIVLPDSRGAIAAVSAQSDVKGLNVPLPDGSVLRPDLLLFDDAQDVARADKPAAIADQVEIIENVFFGLSGPQTAMTVFCACTVEEKGDVSCWFLSRPGYESVRLSRIQRWPGGGVGNDWPLKKTNKQRALWEKWWALHEEKDRDGRDRFYKRHRAAMIRGMQVLWEHRVKEGRDVDAYDGAMYDYYDLGARAFSRGQQQDPTEEGATIYKLTPQIIQSRKADREPGEVPQWSRLRVAATDVNPSYGLTWTYLAFGADQTSAVVGYGIHKMHVDAGATDAETEKAIFSALVEHGRKLAAAPVRPECWIIDAGGAAFDVVLRFALHSERLCGLRAIAATGRGTRNYKPYGKSVLGEPREQCHVAVDVRGRKWVAWHADYWREQSEKAWTGSVGAPGSCSLPAGSHRTFAEQICREQLAGKGEIGGQIRWVWNTQPGAHDYGDCMSMCYMGAAFNGIGTGGRARRRKRYKERRKCKVQGEL